MILREKIRRAWTRDVPHLDRYRAPIQDAREAAGHATAWDRFMPLRPDKLEAQFSCTPAIVMSIHMKTLMSWTLGMLLV